MFHHLKSENPERITRKLVKIALVQELLKIATKKVSGLIYKIFTKEDTFVHFIQITTQNYAHRKGF